MSAGMKYKKIDYVEKPLSKIVYGTDRPEMMKNHDEFELLDMVYAHGINTFDTAAAYGEAEASLGRWMKSRGLRDKLVIITKGVNPSEYRNRLTEYDLRYDIENSFARLQTDYIDVYILHRDDPSQEVGPIVEVLNEYHNAGKIGAFGGSNWTWERTKEANEYAKQHGLIPFTVCSPSFGLAECIGDPWGGSVTLSGTKNVEWRNELRKSQMPVFSYSSLGRGFFSGKLKSTQAAIAHEIIDFAADEYGFPINYEKLRRAEIMAKEKGVLVSQLAYAWLMQQGLNVFGITKPGSKEHLESTIEALNLELSHEELIYLNADQEL